MGKDCLFCRIVSGEARADRIFENDDAVVIRDIAPQAPVHLLVLPRRHVDTLNDASPDLVGRLYAAAQAVARQEGFATDGYRAVINVLRPGGQTIWHLHLHLLAGRPMRWPPG